MCILLKLIVVCIFTMQYYNYTYVIVLYVKLICKLIDCCLTTLISIQRTSLQVINNINIHFQYSEFNIQIDVYIVTWKTYGLMCMFENDQFKHTVAGKLDFICKEYNLTISTTQLTIRFLFNSSNSAKNKTE